jgi:hypothetical protein
VRVPSDTTERPAYYDGQYLGVFDFLAEQQYHRDMLRRLNLGHHTWGIVIGLDVEERPVDGKPGMVDNFILPGLAVDGFGRGIVLAAAFKLEPAMFQGITDEWVLVWLRYATEAIRPPRPGYELCDSPEFRTRVRETFRIEVGKTSSQHSPIVVGGRPMADKDLPADLSIPHQALPEDAEDARWLVPLGVVHWDSVGLRLIPLPTDPTAKQQELQQRRQGRRYAGAVAAEIQAQAGRLVLRDRFSPSPLGSTDSGLVTFLEGSLGIRTPTPHAPLAIRGTGSNEDLLCFEDATGVTRWHVNRNPGGANPGLNLAETGVADARLFFKPGGNTGIRTLDPHRNLHVEGSEVHSGGAGAGFSFGNRQTAAFVENPGAGERWVWYAFNGQARLWSGSDKMAVTPAGRVGIGTSAPEQNLSVNVGLSVDQGDTNDGIIAPGQPFAGVVFGSSSGEAIGSKRTAGGNQFGLDFFTASQPRLRITNAGFVGIGVTPNARLTVGGGGDLALVAGGANPDDPGDVVFQTSGLVQKARIYSNPSPGAGLVLSTQTNSAANLLIDAAGRVGIGTILPQQRLSVQDGLQIDQADANNGAYVPGSAFPGLIFGLSSGEGIGSRRTAGGNQFGLDFYTFFTNRLSITHAGRVGIGTTSPLATLHVLGNFMVSGSKLFAIDHPLDPHQRHLLHAAYEGPEHGLIYRGEGRLSKGQARVKLPAYFESLARPGGRTVQVTPKLRERAAISALAASTVTDGQFSVKSIDDNNHSQEFYWEVKAVRADIDVLEPEPLKEST